MKMKKNEHQGISFDKIIFEKINVEINPEFRSKDISEGFKCGYFFTGLLANRTHAKQLIIFRRIEAYERKNQGRF